MRLESRGPDVSPDGMQQGPPQKARVCVCVRARAACVRVCVCVRACVRGLGVYAVGGFGRAAAAVDRVQHVPVHLSPPRAPPRQHPRGIPRRGSTHLCT